MAEDETDRWAPFRPLVGEWEGVGSGLPGKGVEEMDCEFVLQDKFLRIRNHSVYEPQAKNPEGEVHDDWAFISYDEIRNAFVLREFFVEGYVNQSVLDDISEDGNTLTFLTESIENL
ncbi:MAG: hypothetical protein R3291_03010, partial [Thermoplasmata archaeon]|nr:hypothetical protein [Thermoplasmata archaeon]